MSTNQRRGYLPDRANNTELDEVYRESNSLSFPQGKLISVNYTATIDDRRLYLKQPGLSITLPTLNDSADGYTLFIQDFSGLASTTGQNILPSTGKKINGISSSFAINANFGFLSFRWIVSEDMWFKVG